MDKKNVLILGGAGSLGYALRKHLTQLGHLCFTADWKDPPHDGDHDDQFHFNIDLSDYHELSGYIENLGVHIDLLVNAAALVYGVLGFHEKGGEILTNDLAIQINALRLIEEYWGSSTRFAYLSSSMVYEQGYLEKQEGYDVPKPGDNSVESYKRYKEWVDYKLKAPRTDYGLSKYTGEQMTRSFCKDHDIAYTIWRPFNIITPYEVANKEQGMAHVFADFVRKLITEPAISEVNDLDSWGGPASFSNWRYDLPLIGDGEQVRCFTWIDDVAKGIADHSFDEETINQTFNLGRQEPVTMKELAYEIFHEAQAQGIIRKEDRLNFINGSAPPADDVKYRVPVCTKALKVLDWEATTTLKRSVKNCVAEAAKTAKKHECPPKVWIQSFIGGYNQHGVTTKIGHGTSHS